MAGDYVRLSEGESPATTLRNLHFPALQNNYADGGGADSDDEPILPPNGQQRGGGTWWSKLRSRPERAAEPESAYLTLVPLSDSRLKPQHTNLIVGSLLLLAVASVTCVFLLVPRGVTVGSIQVRSSQISFNTSKSTYQILLQATIPVYNPNYLSIYVKGSINVSFYDQMAGSTPLEPVMVPARTQPQVITLDMDASSVPQKYLFTIYTQCFTFPEKLIFFLTGELQAEYLGKTFSLPNIDNYFIISCNQPSKETAVESAGANQSSEQPLQLPSVESIMHRAAQHDQAAGRQAGILHESGHSSRALLKRAIARGRAGNRIGSSMEGEDDR
uniref:Uncharacterized protein n=1 Tax=Chlamydomonas leiostraca TaxID=1034604 RepID=A0A7S0RPS6_9CHLO|mmetsp:Transcript_28120/g.71707  ORF Transcript_28120/g.71707 Transcript_28120/m.71707 type:complete len:330 (+) Transcript_28120:83-1072(+)|eukprot:CAMPEP_0202869158 /NCGR_PEP_ID=MMETSP1391-20130828/12027_1 /ASSEMBLY_ACC=CAM_ASM_000867 /TAXON_ID=1034604 /ORGANISM="Chlamydomonas leiostraca, Strain SAG 11-49" /LENGTH=329 /DNA_ID=CAMNT_0049549425 /DNA_START=83 /DNA_END=1072 /DNA_ORIENTATION=+